MSAVLFESAELGWRSRIAKCGGILEGEFLFALKKRGRVASKYINLDTMYPYVGFIDMIGREFNSRRDGHTTVVAAPAVGAIPLAYATARAIKSHDQHDVKVVWADKNDRDGTFDFGRMSFRNHVENADVLVVEDIGNSGESAKAVVDLSKKYKGRLVGVHFVWIRGKITADGMGVPYVSSIIHEAIPDCPADEHPMWGKWPLVSDIGHPEYFPDYPGPTINLLK